MHKESWLKSGSQLPIGDGLHKLTKLLMQCCNLKVCVVCYHWLTKMNFISALEQLEFPVADEGILSHSTNNKAVHENRGFCFHKILTIFSLLPSPVPILFIFAIRCKIILPCFFIKKPEFSIKKPKY